MCFAYIILLLLMVFRSVYIKWRTFWHMRCNEMVFMVFCCLLSFLSKGNLDEDNNGRRKKDPTNFFCFVYFRTKKTISWLCCLII